jgi:hypothetical protein
VFIHLDTPVEVAIANVLSRRGRKGNGKEYNPANLYKKAESAANWANRLERNGLNVQRLRYPQAKRLSLELLGLEELSITDLLT